MPHDPIKEFSPVSVLATSPQILVVHPSLPAQSVQSLIALAKARPGELNYASSSVGSSAHLAGALFKAMAGVDMVHIPYKGTGPAVIAAYSGQVHMLFNSAAAVTPHIKAGRLKALAVTSANPSPVFPGLPPIAVTLPGYVSQSTTAMFVPAGTPTAIINRLNQEVVRVLSSPEVKEKFLNVGVEAGGTTPEQLGSLMKSEIAKMGKVIKDAGIRAEE
jgi:tripartite-type tricarboxylate transporter receptor subunit TctC